MVQIQIELYPGPFKARCLHRNYIRVVSSGFMLSWYMLHGACTLYCSIKPHSTRYPNHSTQKNLLQVQIELYPGPLSRHSVYWHRNHPIVSGSSFKPPGSQAGSVPCPCTRTKADSLPVEAEQGNSLGVNQTLVQTLTVYPGSKFSFENHKVLTQSNSRVWWIEDLAHGSWLMAHGSFINLDGKLYPGGTSQLFALILSSFHGMYQVRYMVQLQIELYPGPLKAQCQTWNYIWLVSSGFMISWHVPGTLVPGTWCFYCTIKPHSTQHIAHRKNLQVQIKLYPDPFSRQGVGVYCDRNHPIVSGSSFKPPCSMFHVPWPC